MNLTAADPWVPTPVAVRSVKRETHDTVTLALDPAGGLPFSPGQFNMLYAFGAGEVPVSVSGDPARPDRLLHTVRAVGTVTGALCALRRGAAVGVRGPFGRGWPIEEAQGRDVVIVAGGLGLAPLRPVVYHLLRHRAAFGRIALLYGARSPDDLLYRREFERWRARRDVEVRVAVDCARPGWTGAVGVASAFLDRVELTATSALAMVCGPEPMMRFTGRDLERIGVDRGRIFVSLERNMKCGMGHCGHCQLGPAFVCKDGPVFPYDRIGPLIERREI